MMVLVSRALEKLEKNIGEGSVDDIKGFSDASKVSNYATGSVAKLIKSGVIKGSSNKINPLETATRAETAVIIYRIVNR